QASRRQAQEEQPERKAGAGREGSIPAGWAQAGWWVLFLSWPLGSALPGMLLILAAKAAQGWRRVWAWWGAPGARGPAQERREQQEPAAWPARLAPAWPARLAYVAVAGLVAAGLLSAVVVPRKDLATPLVWSAYAALMLGVTYVAARDLARLEWQRLLPRLWWALIGGGTVASLYMVGAYARAVYPHLLSSPLLSLPLLRIDGPFAGCNAMGTILAGVAGVGGAHLLDQPGRRRWLVAPFLLLVLGAEIVSFSRGGWIAFFLAVALLGMRQRRGGWILAAAAGAFALLVLSVPAVEARFLRIFNLADNQDRLDIWTTAWAMFAQRPLTGWGLGMFSVVSHRLALQMGLDPARTKILWSYAHNIYLNAAAETGVLGLASILLLTLLPLWGAWRLYRARAPHLWGLFPALAGMLVHQQVDIPVLGAGVGGGFWALAGMAVAFGLLAWPRTQGGAGKAIPWAATLAASVARNGILPEERSRLRPPSGPEKPRWRR
ncbi:MAG: O-antigen ligase family protein, partial [Firmicutes bacterium]|nr:O-antigen ligase family protein [Bacillota bacterium]